MARASLNYPGVSSLSIAAGQPLLPVTPAAFGCGALGGGATSQDGIADGWKWTFRIRSGHAGVRSLPGGIGGAGIEDSHPTRRTRKLARLEAVLLVADGALSHRKLAQFATLADAAEARRLVEELNRRLDKAGTAFRVEKVAGGVRMMTRPGFALWLDRLHHRQARTKLSPPMLETLAIVAYRQPVTRADIEKIRGVQSSEMLKQLMDRGLVRIAGEDDSLGRPFLYGTTRQFLEEYGLGSLDDLPMSDTLRRQDEPAEEGDASRDGSAAGDEEATGENNPAGEAGEADAPEAAGEAEAIGPDDRRAGTTADAEAEAEHAQDMHAKHEQAGSIETDEDSGPAEEAA